MSISFDAKKSGLYNSGGTNPTDTFTTAGSNRLLVVGWSNDASNTVTAMTYNGVSMSSIATQSSGTATIGMFILVNPAIGSNTLSITRSNGSGTLEYAIASYNGTLQNSQPDASISGNGGSNNPESTTITTVVNKAWLVGFVYGNSSGLTSGTNMTLRQVCSDNNRGLLDSNATVSPSGVQTVSWSFSGGAPTFGLYVVASLADASQSVGGLISLL